MATNFNVIVQDHLERDTAKHIDIIFVYNKKLYICYNCSVVSNLITGHSVMFAALMYTYESRWNYRMRRDQDITINMIISGGFIKLPSKYDLRLYIVSRNNVPLF